MDADGISRQFGHIAEFGERGSIVDWLGILFMRG